VTDLNGNRISFGRATGRYFGKFISSLTLMIGYMMAGWTRRKQALHDIHGRMPGAAPQARNHHAAGRRRRDDLAFRAARLSRQHAALYHAAMRLLYHLWLSPTSRKIRIVLAEKGLDFTLKVEKVWERRPEFLALNPAGEVPVLIEPDGTVLAEASAIAEFLDEVYRDKLLLGLNPVDRAEVRRLDAWFDGKLNREVSEACLNEKIMKRFLGFRHRRIRRCCARHRPISIITSTTSASSPSGGAGSPAIISRSPT